jgi:hypothetical protein
MLGDEAILARREDGCGQILVPGETRRKPMGGTAERERGGQPRRHRRRRSLWLESPMNGEWLLAYEIEVLVPVVLPGTLS